MASAWAATGDLITARNEIAGCGTHDAGLSMGGIESGGGQSTETEEFNGSTWAYGGSLPLATQGMAGLGLQSAGVAVGGYDTDYSKKSYEYNGTAWASGGDMTGYRHQAGAAGLLSAGLAFGGATFGVVNTTEEYNGTVWSSGGNLIDARSALVGCGTQTAGLAFGGASSSSIGEKTEEYDGTAWSAGGDLTQTINSHGGCGTQTEALSFGGYHSGTVAVSEEYDGTAWSAGGDLNTARKEHAGAGTWTSALAFGGSPSTGVLASTEEYVVQSLGNHLGIAGIDGGVLFNGQTIIGDRSNGKLYALNMDVFTDNGNPITRVRRTQIINKKRVQVLHHKIEVEFEPGVGLDVAAGADGQDPQAILKWSDDGGNSWSAGRSVDIGEFEQYGTRAIWRQLGKSRNRIYELTITDPVKVVLIGADARLTACKA